MASVVCLRLARPFVPFSGLMRSHYGDSKFSYTSEQAINEELSLAVEPSVFYRASTGSFFQEKPLFKNPFNEDLFLQNYLKRYLPVEVNEAVRVDLGRFGDRLVKEVNDFGRQCEENPPQLKQYNAWGQRVDSILTCPAWSYMKELSAQEGLVSAGYERLHGEWSRVYQMSKLYLYAPSAGLYTCPLAMTDGAAKVIESLHVTEPVANAFHHLTSRDPQQFWTSGQWMTERKGGSDVAGGTDTIARQQADGTYKLYGFKWFTSATDANTTLTLARVVDSSGHVVQGSRGLSLFFATLRDEHGELKGIQIQRLKDKLGTRQVPTAELLLDGLPAHRISELGRGVTSIANMLTITRIHNTVSSVASMRRIIQLSREYATKRFVFGKFLKDHALHVQTMARMEVETRAAFLLLMEVCRLLGRLESSLASSLEVHLLRLLTPVAKLYTAKQAIAVVSEGLECFGGQGYMEDTGLPTMLRDAQVLSIWEGTTNVLSLDVLRCIAKSQGKVLEAFFADVKAKLQTAKGNTALAPAVMHIEDALGLLRSFVQTSTQKPPSYSELTARDLAFSLARIYMGALLVDHATWEGANRTDASAAMRWCEQDLCQVATREMSGCYDPDVDLALVYDANLGL